MNSIEMTDADGDALTLITRAHRTWVTCTSGTEEVTVGPLPAQLLGLAVPLRPGPPPEAPGPSAAADHDPGRCRELSSQVRERAWEVFLQEARTGSLREALDRALEAALVAPEPSWTGGGLSLALHRARVTIDPTAPDGGAPDADAPHMEAPHTEAPGADAPGANVLGPDAQGTLRQRHG